MKYLTVAKPHQAKLAYIASYYKSENVREALSAFLEEIRQAAIDGSPITELMRGVYCKEGVI